VQDFNLLFNPRGIAVIGASPDFGKPGGQTMQVLTERGYQGGIYPVNPKYDAIAGRPCFPSIESVPQPCDVAVIALPAAQVPSVVAACGERGVRYAVVLGGGFREGGEGGGALEAQMLQNARAYGMRLIGPNCLGLVNVHAHAYCAFGSVTRPPFLEPGAVSAVMQSGGFGNSLVIHCAAAGIGFRYVVASGNEADITTPELVNAFVDDPQTRVILAYIEGIRDGRAFLAAARRALKAGKPIVAWKAGNTQQGMRAATSHTANMAGAYDIYRAVFRETGIIEVGDMEEAADFVHALLGQPPAEGKHVAIMGGSGGSAVVFSDAADAYGLTLARLATATMKVLRENLLSAAALDNPIDYAAGFINDKNAPRFRRAVDAVLADPGIHQLGVLFTTVTGRAGRIGARALAEASQRYRKPVLVYSSVPRETAPEMFEVLEQARIPIMRSVNRVAKTMSILADYAHARQRRTQIGAVAAAPAPSVALPAAGGVLNEHESKDVLRAFDIPVTDDRLLPAEPVAPKNAEGIFFPVALKVVSRDIAHKSDIGGVRLNIANVAELVAASAAMLKSVHQSAPQAALSGLLVSPMIRDGVETMVGVANDPVFGPVVAFGMGGVYAETLKDVTYRLAPFGVETARDMIGELRASPIFGGLRGQLPRDVDALALALAAVSRLAWSMRDRLAELDINPMLVRPRGSGVVAADALVVLR
jgi:acetyltransferase